MSSLPRLRLFRSVAALVTAAVVLGIPPAAGAAVSAEVMAAAKKEGTVVWYTSVDVKTLPPIVSQNREKLFAGIPQTDYECFNDVLEKLIENANSMASKA